MFINAVVIKGYSEYIEQELEASIGTVTDEDDLEDMIEDFTVRKNEFILLFLLDGVLCIAVLFLVSQIFTRKLARHIMEPLAALSDGAERIRNHDLTKDITYSGDMEFENVCRSFNEMREAILVGQEKNRKYEKARTDMIAGISHDMRTPLTAIRGTINVFSKEQLFEKIWGYDYMGDSATVMVHINRIREKIEDDSKNPKILETVWGAGYRLNK